MPGVKEYEAVLGGLEDWEPYLLSESRLPGPRGNLELAQAAANLGVEAQFRRWLEYGPERAPVNSPGEFVAFCGVVGMGALLAREGPSSPGKIAGGDNALREARWPALPAQTQDTAPVVVLRRCASDPRWRVREGVAMALQRWGDADMEALLREMAAWSQGNLLEQRAAAAALCEPRLLRNPDQVEEVLRLLDRITESLMGVEERKGADFQALRKGLGYCWSVAVAAYPGRGKPLMERWFASTDRDVVWIMKENLRKNRLARMDPEWTGHWWAQMGV
jgi:hypothetical protein